MTLEVSISNWIAEHHPNSTLLRSWDLSGGISSGMTAFEIESPNGQTSRFVTRQPSDWNLSENPEAAYHEYATLEFLKDRSIPAPSPQYLDTNKAFFEKDTLILSYIDASLDLAPNDLDSFLAQYAQQLAAIHKIQEVKEHLPFFEKHDASLRDSSPEEIEALDQSFAYTRCKEALSKIWPIPRLNQSCLLHGDYWPGNTLWKDGSLAAVIDWEEPAFDDPLIDLAISRLDTYWVFGNQAMDTYTKLYLELNPIDTTHLRHWDLFAAIRPGNRLAEWSSSYPSLGRPDITEKHMSNIRRDFAKDALDHLSQQDHHDSD